LSGCPFYLRLLRFGWGCLSFDIFVYTFLAGPSLSCFGGFGGWVFCLCFLWFFGGFLFCFFGVCWVLVGFGVGFVLGVFVGVFVFLLWLFYVLGFGDTGGGGCCDCGLLVYGGGLVVGNRCCPVDWVGMTKWMEGRGECWLLAPCEIHFGFLAFHLVVGGVRKYVVSFDPVMLGGLSSPRDYIAGEVARVLNEYVLGGVWDE
jgi:hypothetical protein